MTTRVLMVTKARSGLGSLLASSVLPAVPPHYTDPSKSLSDKKYKPGKSKKKGRVEGK